MNALYARMSLQFIIVDSAEKGHTVRIVCGIMKT